LHYAFLDLNDIFAGVAMALTIASAASSAEVFGGLYRDGGTWHRLHAGREIAAQFVQEVK
jgi:hypothetical protein